MLRSLVASVTVEGKILQIRRVVRVFSQAPQIGRTKPVEFAWVDKKEEELLDNDEEQCVKKEK